jgi:putative endonuclease
MEGNLSEMEDVRHYVYIVQCCDGTLYTGYTTDIERRIDEHNKGTGARYTRSRTPVRLVYVEESSSKGAALAREYAIKKLSRLEKVKLVKRGGCTG